MSRPIIEVHAISKRYRLGVFDAGTFREEIHHAWERLRGKAPRPASLDRDFWALQDVSFQVRPGDVIGIIGRNGAGKSTLLKILSRITEPTSGRAILRGRIASLLEVGTGFHPELSGRENIYLNGAILGMRRAEIERKFDEIVAFAEVDKFLDTPVKRYSSGMYVRLAFAVAAHLEPEILIVDEVLAVGDTQFQKKCLGKMHDVATGGRTVLFVSHNLQAVRSLCNRCLLLANGQLLLDAGTEQTIAEYSKEGASSASLTWDRPAHLVRPLLAFESIRTIVLGRQPRLQLKCELELLGSASGSAVFIAVDVCDRMKIPIMQALPETKPFIPVRIGLQRLTVEIDLPPLIPGIYSLDFWIGSHFTATTDYVKAVVTFEVDESPTLDRDAPHAADHGFLVPFSRCVVLPA